MIEKSSLDARESRARVKEAIDRGYMGGPSNVKVEQLCTNAHWVNESPF
jgi:hypothetical protein